MMAPRKRDSVHVVHARARAGARRLHACARVRAAVGARRHLGEYTICVRGGLAIDRGLSGKGSKRDWPKCKWDWSVKVRDNGVGMSHENIPNMLGRVLSGTK